jgi:hypothetical protein
MQRSPAVSTTMPGILEPVRGADLEPPHDTLPPITSEAAGTQRSPAANAGTPAIPDPEGSTDLVPPPPPRPPDEAAEPPTGHPPDQIRAPTDVEGPESVWGEELWRTSGLMGLTSAHAPEGKAPLGEAQGRPPGLPDPQRLAPLFGSQSPSIRRPMSACIRRGGPFLTRVPVR